MMDSLKSSSARKLPIKRRPPPLSSSSPPSPSPDPDPSSTLPYSDDAADDDPSSDSLHPPPFKFQRIWSESDEIRFLQGLLGCHAQSMVFPRDLNLFFDRFSEHMAQPFTRSQLSEKLRRLRTKFRIMSGRIHRGQDPSRLAPHDRDILHLCTRLWHPDYAATSPFSSPDAGGGSNKRRRRNPRPLSSASPSQPPPLLPALPAAQEDDKSAVNLLGESEPPQILAKEEDDVVVTGEEEVDGLAINGVEPDEPEVKPNALPVKVAEVTGFGTIRTHGGGNLVKKIVLDVFNECVKEVEKALDDRRVEHMETELSRRWREQQALELDVLSRRLRLVLEHVTP
ncbi:GLABROUS1 enhancer-binding protein family protein [Dioscorea alata]|uniref:GLABROUS1 enhancer-binding protein family protein n=1 Tax=Dioscorea alata TaxID=55571 RepID=A0ACB7U6C2_DIOAL|nr:GLABROUS1 enhancer-binding protein family protein [Dioscorea alata]